MRLAKYMNKIRNRRLDYIHKITSHLAKTYRVIGIEDLNVKGMMSNHNLAMAIGEMGFYEFRRQLEYKTKWYGSEVVVVDRYFPSSKLCNECGWVNQDLTLATKRWRCRFCGAMHDRDLNAAKNLEQRALEIKGIVKRGVMQQMSFWEDRRF